ncbi:LOB domain-containing protein 15-like [Rhododendron vialii]|uniref:LOB domain-containing protein 15-like n=1 Tax=Rhododendron vialii TaxID=182163 RepID=UPI00265DCD5A|nr:LOB domain-containing protein 15-like [Rhododendron vialii]
MSRERERFDEIGRRINKRERDASIITSQQMGINGSNVLGTTNSLTNTITPCAACKLLRRRCAEDCPFSPYFSPLEPYRFAAVHRVFGASNVSKMLMEVPESKRTDTANSLVYEANVRLRDPVYGCMGAISALQQEVDLFQAELNATRTEILRYRYREAANNNNVIASVGASSSTPHAPSLVSTEAAPASPPPPVLLPPPPSVMVSSSSLYTSPATIAMVYNHIPSNISVPYDLD